MFAVANGCFAISPDGGERYLAASTVVLASTFGLDAKTAVDAAWFLLWPSDLGKYHDKGVRVFFPVHKYDNGFSAGDGHRGISDIGNFGHTGHYNNYIECPAELLTFPGGFDQGAVAFPDLNQPCDVYDTTPPVDTSGFEENVVGTLLPYLALITNGPLAGEYCQKHGMTDLGEFLMAQMMKRGMIIEVDHMPRKSYKRAYEI